MIYSVETTAEFNEWFEAQDDKVKGLVRARFSRIESAGNFGTVKSLEEIKMAKTKTSKKQKKSSAKSKEPQYLNLKAGTKTYAWNPTKEL